jgi:hypothetical protein
MDKPAAAAWHAHKVGLIARRRCLEADDQYIDPAESGAVIPILHANGYKIGERTITGAMDNLEVSFLNLVAEQELTPSLPAYSLVTATKSELSSMEHSPKAARTTSTTSTSITIWPLPWNGLLRKSRRSSPLLDPVNPSPSPGGP